MTPDNFTKAVCLACLVIVASPNLVARADTDSADQRTTRHLLDSQVTEKQREIFVRTPINYRPETSYPVVYVLDGEWNFEFVAAYVDYLTDNGVYPPVIVTGIRNTNRNRDYVPRADPNHPHTGGARQFLEFVRSEWISFIDSQLRVSQERVLVGHSFGGVFTLHTLFTETDLFSAYIALSASAWVGDEVLFEEADYFFRKPEAGEGTFLYMAVGEGDGGPTRPSSEKLAALFEARPRKDLEWYFSVTPEAEHFKNLPSGLHEAFMKLFPGWGFDAEMMLAGEQGGAEGVETWFAEKQNSLGWRFHPAWFELSVAAIRLARAGHQEASLAAMAAMRKYHPNDAHIASFSAMAWREAGDFERAEEEIRRALRLAEEQDLDPNAIQIEGLHKRLEALKVSTP